MTVLSVGFIIYFIMACYLDFKRATDLFIVTMITVFFIIYYQVKGLCGDWIYQNIFLPISSCCESKWNILRWYVYLKFLLTLTILLYPCLASLISNSYHRGGLWKFLLMGLKTDLDRMTL